MTLRDLSNQCNQQGLEITFRFALFKYKFHELSTIQYQLPTLLCKKLLCLLCLWAMCSSSKAAVDIVNALTIPPSTHLSSSHG